MAEWVNWHLRGRISRLFDAKKFVSRESHRKAPYNGGPRLNYKQLEAINLNHQLFR
jgi:hypothetical protein